MTAVTRDAHGEAELLGRTALYAGSFLASLDERPVRPSLDVEALREALGGPLPEEPVAPAVVVDELIEAAEGGVRSL